MKNLSSEEMYIVARWRGDAAKVWWTKLSDLERKDIESMPPDQVFILGWIMCQSQNIEKS